MPNGRPEPEFWAASADIPHTACLLVRFLRRARRLAPALRLRGGAAERLRPLEPPERRYPNFAYIHGSGTVPVYVVLSAGPRGTREAHAQSVRLRVLEDLVAPIRGGRVRAEGPAV